MTEKTVLLPPNPSGNGDHAHYRLTLFAPRRRFFSYLRERWWVVMLCVAAAMGGAIAYETLRPESFSSYAQLYLTMGPQLASSMFGEIKDDYATQIELLKGSRLRSAAMNDLGPAAGQLKKPIQIEVVRPMGTSILQLRVASSDPALSQRFLQALIDEYLVFKRQTRLSTTEDLVNSLTDELSKREKELQADQDKWAAFQRTNNAALLQEESHSAGTFLADENVELANLNLQRELLERGLTPEIPILLTNAAATNATSAAQTGAGGGSLTAASGPDADLKADQVELILKRAQLAQTLTNGPQYLVKPLNDQIAQLEQNLAALRAAGAAQRQAQLQDTQARIAAISNAIPGWQAKVAAANDRLSDADQLKADIERQQGYYDHLLALLQNVDLTKNMQQERVTVLDPPSPGRPAQANLGFVLFLAVVLGLAASVGITFVWHLFDDRFVSVRDIHDQFGEAVLGLVPRIKIPRTQPKTALLQEADSRHAYWESYRHLRSAMLLSELGEKRPQTILFTGAMPGEGKTTVAMNLARVLARSGLRVVLVDADPHGGGLDHFWNTQGRPGLLDFLRGEASPDKIIAPSEIPGLNFIGAGTRREQAEGLLRPELAALIAELRRNHDYVILDAAPILAADDAALLVPHADSVVLVVRPFFSRSRMVRRALEMLYQRQAKHVAIVFNQARSDDLAGQLHYRRNGKVSAVKLETSVAS